ncbi:hypothetical protein Leryth_019902 [Lithospermum erythrorhizon]|nr:hypothetical protein Leryth_019902 [Lithospermum erythrorhizon]
MIFPANSNAQIHSPLCILKYHKICGVWTMTDYKLLTLTFVLKDSKCLALFSYFPYASSVMLLLPEAFMCG